MESLQPLVSEWGTSLANSLGAGTGTSAPAVAPVVQGGGASFVQPTAVRLSSASAVEPIRRSIGGGSSAIGSTVVNINNTVSNQAQVDVTSKTGIDGSKTLDIMVTAKVREMFANGTMDQQMRSTFGIRRQPA
jgi:hypothetical protein